MRTRTSARFVGALAAGVLAIGALTGCAGLLEDEDGKGGRDDTAGPASSAPPAASPSGGAATASPGTPPAATDGPEASRPATRRPGSGTPGASKPPGGPGAGARGLVAAPRAGGLVKMTGANAPSDVPVDPGGIVPGVNKVVVAAYGPSATGAREVLVVGVDGMTAPDGKRFEHMVRGMVDHVNATGGSVPATGMEVYDAGPLGGTLECMPGAEAHPAAICGWADRYTTVVAYFDGTPADQAARTLLAMRADLEKEK